MARLQTTRDRDWAEYNSIDPGHAPSTGSATTLTMSDEEMAEVAKREANKRIGFAPPDAGQES